MFFLWAKLFLHGLVDYSDLKIIVEALKPLEPKGHKPHAKQ